MMGSLRFVRTADCAQGSCPVITLADSVEILDMAVSQDGRFGAYEVLNADMTADAFLIGSNGKPQQISNTMLPSNPPVLDFFDLA